MAQRFLAREQPRFSNAEPAREHVVNFQARAVEDIVAEDERDGIASNEIAADDERIGKSARLLLHRIREPNTVGRAVADVCR